MIVIAVLTSVVYHFIVAVYRGHKKVSVITGLKQNTIIFVTLVGSGSYYIMNPMLIFYLHFYFIEKENTGTEQGVKGYVFIPHDSQCK